MPKGIKAGGRDFVKGVSGNPKGRPPLPGDLKEIKKMSPALVSAVISKFSSMPENDLAHYLKSPGTPMFELTIGSIYAKALREGDYMRLNFLLERCVGKVKEQIDVSLQPKLIFKTTHSDDGRLLQELVSDALPPGDQSEAP